MSFEVQISIPTQGQELIARFTPLPQRITTGLVQTIDQQNQLTVGYIDAKKLHGPTTPTTLSVRTARLWQSIRATKASAQSGIISSSIGSNVIYAGVHEFGIDKTVRVGSFTRRNPRADVFKAGASSMATLDKGGHVVRRKARPIAEGISHVRSFTRRMKLPARAYIRSSIQERAQDYGAAMMGTISTLLGGN